MSITCLPHLWNLWENKRKQNIKKQWHEINIGSTKEIEKNVSSKASQGKELTTPPTSTKN
jgi:hypothetical protein